MSWLPRYPNWHFGIPLGENLKAVFLQHQTDALAWAQTVSGGTGTLTDFARILVCDRVSEEFPFLGIYPVTDQPSYEDALEHSDQIGFEIECNGSKPEALAREVKARVAAVRQMVLTASGDELFVNFAGISKAIIELGPAIYDPVEVRDATRNGQYYQVASFTINFRYVQTGG